MMITAHSGCNGTAMNSMEYLRYASSLSVDALEIDIRRNSDGVLLLMHDPISDIPLLTLEKGFEFLRDKKIAINCDLKEYNLEDDVLECAERIGVELYRLIFTGSITDCDSFRIDHPSLEVFINAEELVPKFYEKPQIDTLINRCKEYGYSVINIDYRLCDNRLIEMCKRARISISAWTVDDLNTIQQLKAAGVLNLTTNLAKEAVMMSEP